jgi:hypothetical protein
MGATAHDSFWPRRCENSPELRERRRAVVVFPCTLLQAVRVAVLLSVFAFLLTTAPT